MSAAEDVSGNADIGGRAKQGAEDFGDGQGGEKKEKRAERKKNK